MKPHYKSFAIFAICFASSATYSGWSNKCLDDCFSTHHECNYCSYQCEVDDKQPPFHYSDVAPCPLQGYNRNDNDD